MLLLACGHPYLSNQLYTLPVCQNTSHGSQHHLCLIQINLKLNDFHLLPDIERAWKRLYQSEMKQSCRAQCHQHIDGTPATITSNIAQRVHTDNKRSNRTESSRMSHLKDLEEEAQSTNSILWGCSESNEQFQPPLPGSAVTSTASHKWNQRLPKDVWPLSSPLKWSSATIINVSP